MRWRARTEAGTLPRVWAPAVGGRARGTTTKITIDMELPGVKPEEVEIELGRAGHAVREKASEKFQDEERRKGTTWRIEARAYGNVFQRSFHTWHAD
jgi:HSP20 family molecular chaperone IbpA